MSIDASYKYDLKGQLIGAAYNTGSQLSINYDLAGNRTSVNESGPAAAVDDPSISQIRVSLTSGDPWGLTDVTNGATLYIQPIYDKLVGVWNGLGTSLVKASSFSVSLAGLAAQQYRVYVWDSNGDSVIDSAELVPWTSTPPDDQLVSDGYLVRTGATNRRAIADIMLHATGQADWRDARRGICHIDERSRRVSRLAAFPTDNSWLCLRNTTWRRITGGAGVIGEHFVEFVLSNPTLVDTEANAPIDGVGVYRYDFGFGLDSVTVNSATQSMGNQQAVGGNPALVQAKLKATAAAGKHTLTMIEQNLTVNRDVTVYGDNNLNPPVFKTGMVAEILL